MKTYTFKQLVLLIAEIETEEDFQNVTGGAISRSFQAEKITYKDYEILWKLAEKVAGYKTIEGRK